MNFEIVNAKNLKDGIFEKLVKYGTSLRFQSLAIIQRYKRGFVGKNKEIKLKIQEKYMTLTSLLIFSAEFNVERELYTTSGLSCHPWIKTKFNYLQAVQKGNERNG